MPTASPPPPAAPADAEAALTGRTDTFKRVVFEDVPVPASYSYSAAAAAAAGAPHGPLVRLQPGDYAAVEVAAAGGTLRAVPLARTTLREFVAAHGSAAPLARFGAGAVAEEAEAGGQLLRAVV